MNLALLPFLLTFALINSCIELEISAPSFLDIMVQLQTTEGIVGRTITYNLIGFCLASIIYGPLSEYYGRRRIMLVGNGILSIGAVGCVIAPSIEFLLVTRFIQGIGAATSAVAVPAIVSDVYAARKAAKLSGIMNAVFSALGGIAPVMGGFINAAIGWRGNYGVVAVVCVVSWVLLFFLLPETKHSREEISLRQVCHNYRKLLGNLLFVSAAIVPSLLYGSYVAFVAVAPFLYMKVFGVSILFYTLHQAAIVAVFALTSTLFGRVTERLGPRNTIWLSLSLSTVASALMLCASSPYALTTTMSLYCVGSALLYPIIFAHSLEIFPRLKGTASSAIMSLRYFLCAGITALANYLYNGTPLMTGMVIFGIAVVTLLLTLWMANKFQWEEVRTS